jgi:hypothetical protein
MTDSFKLAVVTIPVSVFCFAFILAIRDDIASERGPHDATLSMSNAIGGARDSGGLYFEKLV